jgi:hypothetical protein
MLMTVGLFAEESVLIDFTKLISNFTPEAVNGKEQLPQNRETVMNFSDRVGVRYDAQNQGGMLKTSLALENWTVTLNSSAKSVVRSGLSRVQKAASNQYGELMGVRINFPTEPWHSHAFIKPPFEIPAFEYSQVSENGQITEPDPEKMSDPSRFENGYGVVKNVGGIKRLAVNVYGLQFPHSLSLVLIDSEGNERTMFMGYLNFTGWKELYWDNPAWVDNVVNRDLRLYPLYPVSTPFVKFGGFLIQRDGDKAGGDFITYFRDVKVIYDKAVEDTDRDINDEGLWHIIQTREEAKTKWEMSRFGEKQILRYLELQKQAQEFNFTESPKKQ